MAVRREPRPASKRYRSAPLVVKGRSPGYSTGRKVAPARPEPATRFADSKRTTGQRALWNHGVMGTERLHDTGWDTRNKQKMRRREKSRSDAAPGGAPRAGPCHRIPD